MDDHTYKQPEKLSIGLFLILLSDYFLQFRVLYARMQGSFER